MISFNSRLKSVVKEKGSCLCVGLDINPEAFGSSNLSNLKEHTFKVIDATREFAVAYKPNFAFFERWGAAGFAWLEETVVYIGKDHITIADAKRGDIGNTSAMYAKAFLEDLGFDAVTVAPYMGKDSVEPFLSFKEKHTILLALTSNKGAFDFQTQIIDNEELYKKVLKTSKSWEHSDQLMYVVGATKAKYFKEIRNIVPNSFLLVPGVGAQGGNMQDVCKYGMNKHVGLLINSSRGIIYASNQLDFAEAAAREAEVLQKQMKAILYENSRPT